MCNVHMYVHVHCTCMHVFIQLNLYVVHTCIMHVIIYLLLILGYTYGPLDGRGLHVLLDDLHLPANNNISSYEVQAKTLAYYLTL